MRPPAAVPALWHRLSRGVVGRLERRLGGAARLQVVLLLAGVLSLTSADSATVGAMASQLESALRVDNTGIGLLVTVSSGVGALTTLPFGVLADRVRRVRLLTASIVVWSGAMVACAAAQSYDMLLLFRLAVGAMVAAAGPLVASLTGDFFAPGERGRIYGYILAGELVGSAVGVLVSGDVAAAFSWRASFTILAAGGLALAWAVRAWLPEPARGGQSRLPVGATRVRSAAEVGAAPATPGGRAPAGAESTDVARAVSKRDIPPYDELVLDRDPGSRSLRWAVRYILSIRTNVVLISASALGYFYFAGLRTFAVPFTMARFGLGQGEASLLLLLLGASGLVGILTAGRVDGRLVGRRVLTARPTVAAICFLLAGAMFVPSLLTASLVVAVPLLLVATAAIGGANPPLDAARLDVMHSRLWGRADSVRTVLRTVLASAAPLLFGYLSTLLDGGRGGGYGHPAGSLPAGALGLDRTFLVMVAPLFGAGLLMLLLARRTYPRDVATAVASERATRAARSAAGVPAAGRR